MVDRLEWKPTEIGELADVLRLAQDVRESNEARLLQKDGVAIAVLVPLTVAEDFGMRGAVTEDDRQAARSAAGAWQNLDTDALLEAIYETRGRPASTSVEQ